MSATVATVRSRYRRAARRPADQQVEWLPYCRGERTCGARRPGHEVSVTDQEALARAGDSVVVFDEENPQRCVVMSAIRVRERRRHAEYPKSRRSARS